MTNQCDLKKALEQSPERAAFRVSPFRDVWGVRVENGEKPYTLIHHLSSTGNPGDPLKHVLLPPYRTLDDLLEDQDKQDEAVFAFNDWYPVNEDTKKMLDSLIGNYSTPGYWPPL